MASLYYYMGRNADGALVRGSIEAGTETAALASLRTRAIFVTSIESSVGVRGAIAATFQLGPVPQKSLVALFRSFAALTRAGVSIRRALDVAISQCDCARLRESLSSVANDMENGLSLSEAMSRHPREFSRLFVAMVRSGEAGGVLDEILERLASVLERDAATRKRIFASLAYPAVVCCAAIGLVLFLLVSIVPMFRAMYEQMHVPLPFITSALIRTGTLLQNPLTWICGTVAAAVVVGTAIYVRGRPSSAALLEILIFRVPIAGDILRKATLARISRTLGTLLSSGVGLVTAIEIVSDAVGSSAHRESLMALRQCLAEGSTVCEPLARSGMYEPMFVQFVRVGEETGALDAMLLRLADYYDVDVETALASLATLLEPAMIVILGSAVGFIVSAIFIPLYTLIGSMK